MITTSLQTTHPQATVSPSAACRLLSACGCSYYITGKKYEPPVYPQKDPFGSVLGWTDRNISFFVNGTDKIDAAIVGTALVDDQPSIVAAFRGTLPPALTIPSLRDWAQDFMDQPIAVEEVPGKVHRGFHRAVDALLEPVVQKINQLQSESPETLPLYITGHSKGGGMATIFTALTHYRQLLDCPVTAVYTFASPHAGDEEFVQHFPESIPVTRYENYLDMVPFLAPDKNFIDSLRHTKGIIPSILDCLVKEGGRWNYAPLGQLMFIPQNGMEAEPLRFNPCKPALMAALRDWEHGLSAIGEAHSHSCRAGYMNGACPAGVCNPNS